MNEVWIFVIVVCAVLLMVSHAMVFLWGVKKGVEEMVRFHEAVWKQAEKATKED